MNTLPQGDVMLAIVLVFGIATACQVIAPKLRIPALILLLPAGFIFGLVAPQFHMDQILGSAFPVVVDLMVAVILFQGGMSLGSIKLDALDRGVVRRLIWIGGPITCICGTLAAHFFIGMPWPLAFLLGAILIVSGPTVVTPILDFAQPKARVRRILLWEGTTLDPLGAIFAVIVFQIVRVSDFSQPLSAVGEFLGSLLIAVLAAIGGVFVAVFGCKLVRGNNLLGTQVLIGSVLVAAGVANYFAQESGLLAALLIGIAAQPLAKRMNTKLDPVLPFFDTIASIGIGVLFVSISALVPSPEFGIVVFSAIAVSLVLIVVVRPAIALLLTRKAALTPGERAFIGWMDPRGIVAAATASSVGASLIAAKIPGAEALLPSAFVIIAVTVFVYGLTAVPVAKALGVRDEVPAD